MDRISGLFEAIYFTAGCHFIVIRSITVYCVSGVVIDMSGYEPERSAFVSRSCRANDSIAILVVMVTAAAAVTLILVRRMESR